MRSDLVLRSGFNFLVVPSTYFRVLFAVNVEATQSERTLSFLAPFNFMNGTIKLFGLFL